MSAVNDHKKCGALEDADILTFCLAVVGASDHQTYHNHCFCCAQPPRMKCIYCNLWRDLETLEEHRPCHRGLHVFVYTEPWPPFPKEAAPRHVPVVNLQQLNASLTSPQLAQNQSNNEDEQISVIEDDNDEECTIQLPDEDIPELKYDPSDADVKPRFFGRPLWVTTGEIAQWPSCIRCGLVRIRNKGWLSHARTCGQDSTYKTRKFFIRLHTKAWCGRLVMDSYWDRHTHPEKGSCELCRMRRRDSEPLPYQPKPKPRPNEAELARRRRKSRIIRKKRRLTMAEDARIQNAGGRDGLQIINCTTLR